MNIERWEALLGELGVAPETDTFSRLQAAYAQKHRAYHTSRHIDECLSLLDEIKHLAQRSAEVECAHIMATQHVALPVDDDSRLVVDIDLAILGATPSRYEEFERDVRTEYRWVPGIVYRPKRAAILQSFLDRPRIYHWEPVFERLERKARTNLSGAVRTLVGGA
jgi:predicted metal-dependent HD superfamily phosphohydrolase